MDDDFLPLQRFTYQQWLARGGTRAGLRRLCEMGQYQRVAQGVYAPTATATPPGRSAQVRHAVQAGQVVLPLLEAAQFHGLWTPPHIPTQLLSADGRRQIPPTQLIEHRG